MESIDPAPALPEVPPLPSSSIGGGLRLFAANWRLVLPFLIVSWLGTVIMSFNREPAAEAMPTAASDVLEMYVDMLRSLALLALSWFLIYVPIAIGQFTVFGRRVLGLPTTSAGALRSGLRRYVPYVATAIAVALTAMIIIAPVFLVAMMAVMMGLVGGTLMSSSQAPDQASTITWTIVAMLASTMFCGVLVLGALCAEYLHLRLSFATSAALLGGRRPLAALKHSWALTRGNMLRIIGIHIVLSLPFIAYLLVLLITRAPGGSVQSGLTPASALFSALFVPFAAAAQAIYLVLWYRMRAEREPDEAADFAAELP